MDNLLVYVWKIKVEDCSKSSQGVARYNNSKDLFICTKDNEKRLVSGALTFKELTQRVLQRKCCRDKQRKCIKGIKARKIVLI